MLTHKPGWHRLAWPHLGEQFTGIHALFPDGLHAPWWLVLPLGASVAICHRLENSRIGRAWMAVREDEAAARAMGLNTRDLKLAALGMGATFDGVAGAKRYRRLDAHLLRQLLVALAMISVMVLRPRGLWPPREHGKSVPHRH